MPGFHCRSGAFKKPAECTLADLTGELKRNEDLAKILGVDPDSAEMAEETLESEQNLVAKAGFSPEVATLLVNNRAVLTTELINTVLARHAAGLAKSALVSRAVRSQQRAPSWSGP